VASGEWLVASDSDGEPRLAVSFFPAASPADALATRHSSLVFDYLFSVAAAPILSPSSMKSFELDVVVTRGAVVESRHRVHAAVVDETGALIGAARDPSYLTAWRSCAKPFQVMPFLESGGFDKLGWGDDQLALACASHGGEPEHIALAESMLSDIGMEEGDLACGPHEGDLSRRIEAARAPLRTQ